MNDMTVKKIDSGAARRGDQGKVYLASGKRVSMRVWQDEPVDTPRTSSRRDYETVGYVIKGRAELQLEDQRMLLEPGDSWLVPMGALHSYRILEPFTAVEATSPPAQM